MLTAGIHNSYVRSTESRNSRKDIKLLATGSSCGHAGSAVPALYSVSAQTFQSDAWLHEEVFGRCSLVVWCESMDEMKTLLAGLDGNFTCTLHASAEEMSSVAPSLIPLLQSNAGRIIMNGFPTGVEAVSHAIVRYMLYFRRKQQHSSHGLNHFAGAWWPLSRTVRRQNNVSCILCHSSIRPSRVLSNFSGISSSRRA